MNKKQLEDKYQIEIEWKETVYYVFNKEPKILLFLAPNLDAIDKSMQFKAKSEI